MKTILLLFLSVLFVLGRRVTKDDDPAERAAELLAEMTLDQKLSMVFLTFVVINNV